MKPIVAAPVLLIVGLAWGWWLGISVGPRPRPRPCTRPAAPMVSVSGDTLLLVCSDGLEAWTVPLSGDPQVLCRTQDAPRFRK